MRALTLATSPSMRDSIPGRWICGGRGNVAPRARASHQRGGARRAWKRKKQGKGRALALTATSLSVFLRRARCTCGGGESVRASPLGRATGKKRRGGLLQVLCCSSAGGLSASGRFLPDSPAGPRGAAAGGHSTTQAPTSPADHSARAPGRRWRTRAALRRTR